MPIKITQKTIILRIIGGKNSGHGAKEIFVVSKKQHDH